jgi:hypothetical protein
VVKQKYRDRVEVFGKKDGKIFGGIYTGDGTFGTFGGGLDGDSIVGAAKKEYKEESGYSIKNVKQVSQKPLKLPWVKRDGMNAKQIRRIKEYPAGTRTFYAVGDLQRKGKKASGEDGQSGLKNKRLYSMEEIKKLLKPKSNFNQAQRARVKSRLKALKKISSYNQHIATGNTLFPGKFAREKVKSTIKEKIGSRYSNGQKISNSNSERQWMPI